MKVLCKKTSYGIIVNFKIGELYKSIKNTSGDYTYYLINYDDGVKDRAYPNFNGGIHFSVESFNDYFYTPDETKNILRTKLIDKIMEKTIEKTIRKDANEWGVLSSEYIIRVQEDLGEDGLRVYIRPSDRGGDTIDFIIKGNEIKIMEW